MNKKVIYIFLFLFTFFIGLNVVQADTSCSDIDEKIELYNYHKNQLDGLDCTDTSSENVVAVCNDSQMQKNALVIELMRLNDSGNVCKAKQSEVKEIVEENADSCSKVLDNTFTDIVNKLLILFNIIGPILLVVFGSLDYANAVVSSDPALMKKANQRFIKRLTATILLILAPVLTNIILSFNTSNYALSGDSYSCNYTYSAYFKNWNINYVPKQSTTTLSSKSGSGSSNASIGGTQEGGYTIFKQSDDQWGSKKLLQSSRNTIASAGCALCSVAMAIVNSGVETTEPINPGTLNDILLQNGSYSGGSIGWGGTTYATNGKFTLASNSDMSGNFSDKTSQLSTYISQGYYPVIQVKYGSDTSTHYVTVFSVEDGNVYIGDPATGTYAALNSTNYPITYDSYSSQIILYQKN